jgi:hypothetical protein
MFSLFSKKFLMAGVITITLPFGTYTLTSPTVMQVVETQNPTTQTTQPIAVNSGAGSNTSFNWSGYEAVGGTFTGISGTWTVPAVASASSTEADATWIGIGGVSAHDLIQAGTQAVINGSGAPSYQAWYEILPQTTTQVPVGVLPGDSMSASLVETSPASGATPAEWSVTIRNNTTGQSYQTSLAYNSSLSSAEWIEEMPSDGTSFVPLDNFGSVSFTGGTATENGVTQTISGANAQALTMVNGSDQTLASPSSIGADGESFNVTRTSASVAQTFGGSGGGLGRGWRRTGVGVQGYTPRTRTAQTAPTTSSASGSGGSGSYGYFGGYGQQWLRILQQFQQLRQQIQIRGSYVRDSFLKIGR